MFASAIARQMALRKCISRSPTCCFIAHLRLLHIPGSKDADFQRTTKSIKSEKSRFSAKPERYLGRSTEFSARNPGVKKERLPKQLNVKSILREGRRRDDNEDKVQEDHDDDSEGLDTEENREIKMFKVYSVNSPTMEAFMTKLQTSGDKIQYSNEDWKKLESDSLSENPELKKKWETMCMQVMYASRRLELTGSFMGYLLSKQSTPNLATLCLYMGFLGQHGGRDKEQAILDTFHKVQEITDVFDSTTAKYVIYGLAATSQWRKALNIVEMVKITMAPGPSYYSPIITAALQEDADFAFQLLEEIGAKGIGPQPQVLQKVLQLCTEAEDHGLLERYMSCMWKFSWQLPLMLAQEIEKYFTVHPMEKWSCKWTNVNTVKGICHACKQDMRRIELATSDFEALQREFLERTLVGSNIYLKSNPQEVERFRDFIMKYAPFDVVLDSLNIAFKGSGSRVSVSKQLREMVHYFAQLRHLKVLVIGRDHMKKWNSGDMAYIRKNANVFLTDNISSDDPFVLYATLYSGKDALFVSGDFMRDHKFNLGVHLKDVFVRWQKSRQIVNFQVFHDGVTICLPNQYDCGPVKDDKGWHIPYVDGKSDLRSSQQPVLCLRYKGQRAASAAKRTRKPKHVE